MTENVDCNEILLSKRNARQEPLGIAPTDGNDFIAQYTGNTDFKKFIDDKWGQHAFSPSHNHVTLAGKMRDGLKSSAWGQICTGKILRKWNSRHNAKNYGAKCCSKFQNGQIADKVDNPHAPGARGEDCGYGWTKKPKNWDEDLQMRRTVPPPAWMADILTIKQHDLPGCNIKLKSGVDFVNDGIYDALEHLNDIYQCICKSNNVLNKNLFGSESPFDKCSDCERKISALDQHWINVKLCENTIIRIITLFQNLHNIARKNVTRSSRKALSSFGNQFVKLCNKLPGAGESKEGGGKYKKRRTRRRKRRTRKRRWKRKTRKKKTKRRR
jgi:hypothetical protein